jgi:hypothetical protein
VNEACPDAPKLSGADVHITGVVPTGNRLPDGGTHVTACGPSTVSEAVGAGVYVTVDPLGPFASTTWFGGTTTVGGAFVTFTVTPNEPDDWLLRESMLVHETVVGPGANVEPEAGEQFTGRGPSTASVAVASKFTVAPAGLAASVVIPAGSVRTGPVVSWTVIVNVPVAVLFEASVAVHVTVVGPKPNVDPEGGLQETVTACPLSVAEAAYVATAPDAEVASTAKSGGSDKVGGVVSWGGGAAASTCTAIEDGLTLYVPPTPPLAATATV